MKGGAPQREVSGRVGCRDAQRGAPHPVGLLGGANQQWQLVPTGDGYYRLLARHSAKSLDGKGVYANGRPFTVGYVGERISSGSCADRQRLHCRSWARHSGKRWMSQRFLR
jgi:hypothetical protein